MCEVWRGLQTPLFWPGRSRRNQAAGLGRWFFEEAKSRGGCAQFERKPLRVRPRPPFSKRSFACHPACAGGKRPFFCSYCSTRDVRIQGMRGTFCLSVSGGVGGRQSAGKARGWGACRSAPRTAALSSESRCQAGDETMPKSIGAGQTLARITKGRERRRARRSAGKPRGWGACRSVRQRAALQAKVAAGQGMKTGKRASARGKRLSVSRKGASAAGHAKAQARPGDGAPVAALPERQPFPAKAAARQGMKTGQMASAQGKRLSVS